MSNNAFSGKVVIAPADGGFNHQVSYDKIKGFTIPAGSEGDSLMDEKVAKVLAASSDLKIEPKSAGKREDSNLTSTTVLEEVSVEFDIAVELGFYHAIVDAFQGKECELRVIDHDTGTMAQVTRFVPFFAPTTKIGSVQEGKVSGSYKQAANIPQQNKRYRVVKIDTEPQPD